MKKIIAFMLVFILSFCLCGCDPDSYVITEEALKDIASVELINYENSNQKKFLSWVPDQFDLLAPFNNENASVEARLPDEQVSDFLNAFMETDILHTYYAYDSPKGICLRLNYSNGNFLIIWSDYVRGSYAGYIGEYLPNGTVLSFWGSFSDLFYYVNLVENYFSFDLT